MRQSNLVLSVLSECEEWRVGASHHRRRRRIPSLGAGSQRHRADQHRPASVISDRATSGHRAGHPSADRQHAGMEGTRNAVGVGHGRGRQNVLHVAGRAAGTGNLVAPTHRVAGGARAISQRQWPISRNANHSRRTIHRPSCSRHGHASGDPTQPHPQSPLPKTPGRRQKENGRTHRLHEKVPDHSQCHDPKQTILENPTRDRLISRQSLTRPVKTRT